jgi:hypothetical protein
MAGGGGVFLIKMSFIRLDVVSGFLMLFDDGLTGLRGTGSVLAAGPREFDIVRLVSLTRFRMDPGVLLVVLFVISSRILGEGLEVIWTVRFSGVLLVYIDLSCSILPE